MKLFSYGKDGGRYSTVWGFWLIEIKALFSIVLLCFENGSREAYHEHAFNCISWVLSGELHEELVDNYDGDGWAVYRPSIFPVITRRSTFHKVTSRGRTWVISFRGPWAKTWREYLPNERRTATLTHGRREVA